jgi:hypothetical protein
MKLPIQALCEFDISMAGNQNFPTTFCESFPYQIKKICSGAVTRSLINREGQGQQIIFFYFVRNIKRGGNLKGSIPL